MEKIVVDYCFSNSVAKIVLSSGKGNVLDSGMMNELHDILSSLKNMKDIKLIIFEGAGKHFSFGASVEEHTKEKAQEMLSNFHQLFYEIIELSIPTIAIISGQCLGGGLELALICNFLWADKSAKFGQPEIVLAVFAPVASVLLPQKINSIYADSLLITGQTISAEEAYKIGLINEIFENKEVMDMALNEWIEKNILPKSASSLRYAVKVSRNRINSIFKKKLPKLENIYIKELMETYDANEGITAFLEKRPPVWRNS